MYAVAVGNKLADGVQSLVFHLCKYTSFSQMLRNFIIRLNFNFNGKIFTDVMDERAELDSVEWVKKQQQQQHTSQSLKFI